MTSFEGTLDDLMKAKTSCAFHAVFEKGLSYQFIASCAWHQRRLRENTASCLLLALHKVVTIDKKAPFSYGQHGKCKKFVQAT
jgi:hypothetical protein